MVGRVVIKKGTREVSISGQCRCGALSYTVKLDGLLPIYACHCLHCQASSGSAFAEYMLLPRAALVTKGLLATYRPANADAADTHHRCAICQTAVFKESPGLPGHAILHVGTLADSALVSPAAHIWVRRKQPWVIIPDGTPVFDETPSPEAFGAALA